MLSYVLTKCLRWSNTRQAWLERLGTFGTLTGGLLLWFLGTDAPLWFQVAGWAMLTLILAYFWRRGWVRLTGPLLVYYLIRTARRSSFFVIRFIYLGVLFCAVCLMYYLWAANYGLTPPHLSSEAAALVVLCFVTFMLNQLVLILVVTPAFTAGVIADEKERKTLDFLFATDLNNCEIVLGKLLPRVGYLSLYVLAGLPMMSALLFLGGISPYALLAGYALTFLTLASLAAVSVLASVLARRTRDAVFFVYVGLAAYLLLSFQADQELKVRAMRSSWWDNSEIVEQVLLGIRAGNPVLEVRPHLSWGGFNDAAIPTIVGKAALFHGSIVAACLIASVVLLRRLAEKTPVLTGSTKGRVGWWRPALGWQPMLWKEVWCEKIVTGRARGLVVASLLVLVAFSFLPVLWIHFKYHSYQNRYDSSARFSYGVFTYYYLPPATFLANKSNEWLRLVGTMVALVGLGGVGVRAATSVRREYEHETMGSLLCTTLCAAEILFAKWFASLAGLRWFVPWLLLIWLIGVTDGGLDLLCVPFLAAACLSFAAAMASIGLWCSVVCRTSTQALFATLLAPFLLIAVIWFPFMMLVAIVGRENLPLEEIGEIPAALSPPLTLWHSLPLSSYTSQAYSSNSDPSHILDARTFPMRLCLGTCCAVGWAVFARVVWRMALNRFKRASGRLLDSPLVDSVVSTDGGRSSPPLMIRPTSRG